MYIDCLQAVDGKVHFVYKKESAIHSFFYFISFSFISQIYEYIININLFAPFYSKYCIFLYFKHALLGHFFGRKKIILKFFAALQLECQFQLLMQDLAARWPWWKISSTSSTPYTWNQVQILRY